MAKETMDAKGGDGGDSVLSALRRRVGETGEVLDFFGNRAERAMARVADTGIPMLSSGAKLLKPAIVGARAALANATSGGGRYYQPEVRDETNFSKDELESMAMNLMKHDWKGATRYGYTGGPATRWANSQSVGGASVRGGAVTDVFDVDSKDPYGVLSGLREAAESHAMRGNVGKATAFGTLADLAGTGHKALGAMFGDENTPDRGKVRTRIPLDKLSVNPRTTGTSQEWADAARGLEEFGAHMDNLPSARISTRQAAKGGDASGSETEVSETPVSEAPQNPGGPRIVINPTTFHNKKDALCVAFNEGFRLWMEANDFQPRSEPTDAQRKFFSDTAYADDELQLRRTILARIATFDTSVKDPTDDQLAETAEFLGAILESDWCKNDWERDSVSRLAQAAQAAVGAEPVEARQEPLEAREAEPLQARAAMGGGETDDEEKDKPGQAVPAQETDSGMDGVMQQEQDVNGDGTVIDHSADYEAQLDLERQEDMAETNAEYEKLRQSGALDDLASFDNSGQTAGQGQPQEPGVSARPGGESGESGRAVAPAGPAETGPDVSTQGTPRRGGIENGVVSKDSPGSLSYRGPRRGGIENPIVDPLSQGSIEFSGVRGGGIESPIVDLNSPGFLSYRRRRRRKR